MALKKGKPRRGLTSPWFLKMSALLLLPDPVLNQHLQIDHSAYQGNGDSDAGEGRDGGREVCQVWKTVFR